MTKYDIMFLLAILGLFLGFMTAFVIDNRFRNTAPCEKFSGYNALNVPARCFNNFNK